MRKVVMLVAMLAMVLLLAAPAFAQTVEAEFEQDLSQYGAVDNSVCSQVYNVGVQQANFGNQEAEAAALAGAAEAEAEDGSATAASVATANAVNVANAADVSIGTGNVCLNNFGGGNWWNWLHGWWGWWW